MKKFGAQGKEIEFLIKSVHLQRTANEKSRNEVENKPKDYNNILFANNYTYQQCQPNSWKDTGVKTIRSQ